MQSPRYYWIERILESKLKIVTSVGLKRNSRLEVILKVESKVKDSLPELKLTLSRDIRSTVTISSFNTFRSLMENASTSRYRKKKKNILIRIIFPIIRNDLSSFTSIEQLFTTQIRWIGPRFPFPFRRLNCRLSRCFEADVRCHTRVRFNGRLITQLKGDWLGPTTHIHHISRRDLGVARFSRSRSSPFLRTSRSHLRDASRAASPFLKLRHPFPSWSSSCWNVGPAGNKIFSLGPRARGIKLRGG